ncbi:histone deacetylase [Pseudoalteromonas fenneropenaei]|uniref:Histone deacetylase n=1 Tax=Pseudoalteromonas fenneropenaei TaxID=1737459 RepID=A0ABV7CM98_9GAMM
MIFYSDTYSALDLPERHRFPIKKYQQLFNFLHTLPCRDLLITDNRPIDIEYLQLAHCPLYVERFLTGTLDAKAIRKIGFPWDEKLCKRTLASVGNTLRAAEYALLHGVAANIGGGYHHAHYDYGAGYCIFNDCVVAAKTLLAREQVTKVLIFDCDVHQGDGSATMCASDELIITCSLHCEQNFPTQKACSDYDFALPPNTTDELYLRTVNEALSLAIRLHQPDIVFYNAGADIFKHDELGHFALSLAGVKQRDARVLAYCKQAQIPVVAVLGGGYQRNTQKVVEVHLQLFYALLENLDLMV